LQLSQTRRNVQEFVLTLCRILIATAQVTSAINETLTEPDDVSPSPEVIIKDKFAEPTYLLPFFILSYDHAAFA
jgi:hypothetical protein